MTTTTERANLTEQLQALSASVRGHDTTVSVWLEEEREFPVSKLLFRRVVRFLTRIGFAMGPCLQTAKRYPTLAPSRKRGAFGDLQVKAEVSGRSISIEFFQEIVRENVNGGEYDFDKLKKMPYVVRLRFLWAACRLQTYLQALGVRISPRKRSIEDGDSPLAAFNDGWGADRFRRGPDGWPDESELKSWHRKDGDGVVVNNGETRYVRVRGRWLRCKVFGGINGMWLCVHAGRTIDNVGVYGLRSVYPGPGRHFEESERQRRRQAALDRAVKAGDFLRAHAIQSAMKRSLAAGGDAIGCSRGEVTNGQFRG